MRTPIAVFVAAALVLISSVPAQANEATRLAICFRVNRSGEVLQTRVYCSRVALWREKMLAAIRAAGPFPPLPEGSPEYVDFHYDVVCGCTGALWADEMRLCDDNHDASTTKAPQTVRQYVFDSKNAKFRKF